MNLDSYMFHTKWKSIYYSKYTHTPTSHPILDFILLIDQMFHFRQFLLDWLYRHQLECSSSVSFLFFIFPSFSSFHPEVVCPVKWSPHSTCSDHLTIKQWLPGSEALQIEFQNLGDKETGNFQIISQPMN